MTTNTLYNECLQYIKEKEITGVRIKNTKYGVMVSYNDNTFKVSKVLDLHRKVRELRNYVKPELIDLTSRIAKIEENTLKCFN